MGCGLAGWFVHALRVLLDYYGSDFPSSDLHLTNTQTTVLQAAVAGEVPCTHTPDSEWDGRRRAAAVAYRSCTFSA